MNAQTYSAFCADVDHLLYLRYGCSRHDLPDYLWRDAWEDGASPGEAFEDYVDENWDL
jgi:hypothetical protein